MPRMHGVGGRPGHPEARSDRSHGVHDRWSGRHHRHATKPGRQAVPRGEQSHEERITVRTPDGLDWSDDSSKQHRRQGERR